MGWSVYEIFRLYKAKTVCQKSAITSQPTRLCITWSCVSISTISNPLRFLYIFLFLHITRTTKNAISFFAFLHSIYRYTYARTLVPYHRILPSDILGVFGSGMINRTFRILYIIRIIRTSNADFLNIVICLRCT